MESKPFQYDCLKAVLKHLDANVRFELSARIPAIQKTEKIVPLKINRLHFSPYTFEVNNTIYKFGTYRNYIENEIPLKHQEENENGGFSGDLDKFGNEDNSSIGIVTPGDLAFCDKSFHIGCQSYPMYIMERLEKEVKVMESLMAQKEGKSVRPISITDADERHIFNRHKDSSVDYIFKNIQYRRALLQPFLSQRDGLPVPFTKMIQFTVVHSNGRRHIQRKHCDGKLFEVQKKLTTFLFGNRKDPIFVERFEVSYDTKIIRLPHDLKIRLKELSCSYNINVFCNELQKIITETPHLDVMETLRHPTELFHHPFIKTAKILRLELARAINREKSFLDFLSLSNQEVHVKCDRFTLDEYVRLIKHWIENDREVGTCYTFGYLELQKFNKLSNVIINELNGVYLDTEERVVGIPIRCSTQIEVSCISYLETYANGSRSWKFTLKTEITSQ
ncbi:unnamed protein product [Caenorhabditis brenneri]